MAWHWFFSIHQSCFETQTKLTVHFIRFCDLPTKRNYVVVHGSVALFIVIYVVESIFLCCQNGIYVSLMDREKRLFGISTSSCYDLFLTPMSEEKKLKLNCLDRTEERSRFYLCYLCLSLRINSFVCNNSFIQHCWLIQINFMEWYIL